MQEVEKVVKVVKEEMVRKEAPVQRAQMQQVAVQGLMEDQEVQEAMEGTELMEEMEAMEASFKSWFLRPIWICF
jgi:hypothetical protein